MVTAPLTAAELDELKRLEDRAIAAHARAVDTQNPRDTEAWAIAKHEYAEYATIVQPKLCAAAREREALSAENARLRVMVSSEAEREAPCYAASWPPKEIIAKLVAAADHLLHDHSCDQHGYEGLQIAMAVAKNWLAYGEVEASTTDNDRLRAALQEIADLDPSASLPSQLAQRALDGAR